MALDICQKILRGSYVLLQNGISSLYKVEVSLAEVVPGDNSFIFLCFGLGALFCSDCSADTSFSLGVVITKFFFELGVVVVVSASDEVAMGSFSSGAVATMVSLLDRSVSRHNV